MFSKLNKEICEINYDVDDRVLKVLMRNLRMVVREKQEILIEFIKAQQELGVYPERPAETNKVNMHKSISNNIPKTNLGEFKREENAREDTLNCASDDAEIATERPDEEPHNIGSVSYHHTKNKYA